MAWILPNVWVLYRLIFQAKFLTPFQFQDAFCDNFVIQWHPLAESLHNEHFLSAPSSLSNWLWSSNAIPCRMPRIGTSLYGPSSWRLLHGTMHLSSLLESHIVPSRCLAIRYSFSDFKVMHSFQIFARYFMASCLVRISEHLPAIDVDEFPTPRDITNIDPVHRKWGTG